MVQTLEPASNFDERVNHRGQLPFINLINDRFVPQKVVIFQDFCQGHMKIDKRRDRKLFHKGLSHMTLFFEIDDLFDRVMMIIEDIHELFHLKIRYYFHF